MLSQKLTELQKIDIFIVMGDFNIHLYITDIKIRKNVKMYIGLNSMINKVNMT